MGTAEFKQEVNKIQKFGWDIDRVSSYLDLNSETIKDLVSRSPKTKEKSSKTKSIKIHYFRIFLEEVSQTGAYPSLDLVVSIPVMEEKSFSKFIDEHYSDNTNLVVHIIRDAVKRFAANRLAKDYVGEFKNKYGMINEESLAKAALEEPQFLADFITQGKIKNFTKALATSKLGLSLNDDFIGLLKTLSVDTSALVREGAYQALAYYFIENPEKYASLYSYFVEGLKKETGDGVKKTISSLIRVMDMHK